MSEAVPVAILFGLLLLAFAGMWWGWRRRGRKHDLPPLPAVTPVTSRFGADGRYFGTAVAGDWLDRVVARGLGSRSDCTLVLGEDGVDVRRPGLESFRIPATALGGARHDLGIAGKVVPPHGVLVVTWRHGGLTLDSGFRLAEGDHDRWVEGINKLVKEHSS
jgi:hypothetical protein